uniref:Uncharacterized protein n=1 Tax=Euplotes harpa TaxID=151035 RepID=A0A7S3NA26_9SPIT|mmetsp:Transcript_28912/g.33008  ORF Transcript_28912/g.33008 Transcript_28912/m.33008 type:complete len:135 (+) Transcript_28912:34-438(+)|eukprot:CAMPEP_0168325426 /NCGR_PEP_ID=MMETSP0213-20121227/4686_1 /TAXON_ID=151035 /ORGANISM="Euplotes harpa, Strain FSP1.4" /LENGTH=134 /DNA_ID=CAMNT_0008327919 /DNA_START=209 /DNA_END=613 /DNA_ORIENTATION=+
MADTINELVSNQSVLVIGNSNELETQLSVDILKGTGAQYYLHDAVNEANPGEVLQAVEECFGTNKLPLIFIAGELLGGYFELKEQDKNDELITKLCSFGIPNNAMPEGDDYPIQICPGAPYENEDDGDIGGLFD